MRRRTYDQQHRDLEARREWTVVHGLPCPDKPVYNIRKKRTSPADLQDKK